jgi:hypothetical protein
MSLQHRLMSGALIAAGSFATTYIAIHQTSTTFPNGVVDEKKALAASAIFGLVAGAIWTCLPNAAKEESHAEVMDTTRERVFPVVQMSLRNSISSLLDGRKRREDAQKDYSPPVYERPAPTVYRAPAPVRKSYQEPPPSQDDFLVDKHAIVDDFCGGGIEGFVEETPEEFEMYEAMEAMGLDSSDDRAIANFAKTFEPEYPTSQNWRQNLPRVCHVDGFMSSDDDDDDDDDDAAFLFGRG